MANNDPDPTDDEFDFEFVFGDDASQSAELEGGKLAPDGGDAVIRKRAGSASAQVVPAAAPASTPVGRRAPAPVAEPELEPAVRPEARVSSRSARTVDGEVVVRRTKSMPKSAASQALARPSPPTPNPEEKRLRENGAEQGGDVSKGGGALPTPRLGSPVRPIPDPFAIEVPHELDAAIEEGAFNPEMLPRRRSIAGDVGGGSQPSSWRPATLSGGRSKLLIGALGIAALGVVAFFLFKGTGNRESQVEEGGGGAIGTPPTGAVEMGEGKPLAPRTGESLADIKFRIDDTLEKFFSSADPAGLLPFVRDPERVQPLIENYYARHVFGQPKLERVGTIEDFNIHPTNPKFFWIAEVRLAGGEARTVVLEDTDAGFVVDWETFVSYNPMEWDDYARGENRGRVPFRVYATLDHKPGYAFPEPSEWICVRLTSRGGDRVLYGYASKGSDVASRIERMLTNEWEYPCILELEFPDDSKGGDDQVHIRRLVIEHWIMVE